MNGDIVQEYRDRIREGDWDLIREYGVAAALVALLLAAFALSWLQLPFVVVHGASMQPTYETGDLVTVEATDPSTIEEGDIVVVDVPHASQEEYGYPDQIVHRVKEVRSDGDRLSFRTQGDNTGEDPFTVYAQNIEGTAGTVVPNIGFVILYLQSIHGKIFILSVLLIEFTYTTAPTVRREIGEEIDAFVDRHSPSRDIEEKIDELDEETEQVHRSLDHFASAMDEYATHLESHTTAVQNMAKAASDIQQSVERQTELLEQLEDAAQQDIQLTVEDDDLDGFDDVDPTDVAGTESAEQSKTDEQDRVSDGSSPEDDAT